jgi:hypothetical protein
LGESGWLLVTSWSGGASDVFCLGMTSGLHHLFCFICFCHNMLVHPFTVYIGMVWKKTPIIRIWSR